MPSAYAEGRALTLALAGKWPAPSVPELNSPRVNGELRQTLVMDDLIFSFADLVSYISEIIHLQAGDTILTGSPAGMGALSKNWLKDGDVLEVSIPGIGFLKNSVVVES